MTTEFSCRCGATEPDNFYSYLRSKCKSCHKDYQREYRRRQAGNLVTKDKKYALKKRYGITPEQFEQMIDNQDARCAICREGRLLHVDHDHTTGQVRGLLCNSCNRALGFLRDDARIARSAARYLDAA